MTHSLNDMYRCKKRWTCIKQEYSDKSALYSLCMQVISFKKNIHTALLIQIAMLYQMFVSYFYFLF